MRSVLILLLVVLFPPGMPLSIADWIWGNKDKVDPNYSDREVRNGVIFPDVPFETATSDERFLQEAQNFGLATSSQLDACQQTVILRLKSSCSSLTEEQLAKLSVSLLNCQSAVEGRPQYPCSDEMTLRQCTGDMDADVWNTYHLMNNRARAVCLTSRQAQFRALTEMTVNKLMNSAQGQINALESLKSGQEKLSAMTEEGMLKVTSSQDALVRRQERLKVSQQQAHSFVAHSLQELAREKSLIAAGHRELARMATLITSKLDVAEKEINTQSEQRKAQHKQVLTDLKKLQDQATKIWTDIDVSTQNILQRHELAVQQYETTLQSLQAINASVIYLQNIMVNTQVEIDKRLGWITEFLGGAGDRLDKVTSCLAHVGFLLSSMLVIAFIGAPTCTKVLLVLFVALNVSQIVMQGPDAAIPLPATIFLIIVGTMMHQFIHSMHQILYPNTPPAITNAPEHLVQRTPLTSKSSLKERISTKSKELWAQLLKLTGSRETGETLNSSDPNEDGDSDSETDDSGLEDPGNLPRFASIRANNGSLLGRTTPLLRRSRSKTPSRSGTPRPLCSATCLNGQPCRLYASGVGNYCSRHSS